MNKSSKYDERLVRQTLKPTSVALLMLMAGCDTTSHKVTGPVRAPVSPDVVKVYSVVPVHSETVGTVSVASFYGFTVQQLHDDVLNQLKSQAAGMGANGVVIETSDEAPLSGS